MAEAETDASPRSRAKILGWILLAFAAVFAAGSFAWYLAASRPSDVIEVRCRQIFVQVGDGESDEIWAKAKEKMDLDGGADFGALARKHSEGPAAERGGELPWIGRGNMPAAFDEAAWGGEVGEVIGPVRTDWGYHLIEVLEKR